MRLTPFLLTGSGKSAFVLDRFREALRAGDDAIRLLAPTATMAQHLQNRLAREGFVFRRKLIQTLSGFVEDWAGDVLQAPDAVLYLMVEEAARRVNRPEFVGVAHMPGFCASLAHTIAEFSSAGCDSARLAKSLPESPLGAAFLAVYQEVDRELERRGLAMRAKRLERAAERIESQGLGGIRAIWLDGFHALPDPELRVIEALSHHADLTLTLGDGDATETVRARLRAMGFREERAGRPRATPAMALVRAPAIEREAEEIARRILEQAAAGRPFREMGIIVRAAETYVPVLRSTLERFGIPARFYFDSEMERHAAVRFLSGAVDAMLGGWDHAQTLKVLRLAPRFADSNVMDRFDFAVREQIPNAGLGALKALLADTAGAERLMRLIDALGAIEEWRSFEMASEGLGGAVADVAESVPAGRECRAVWGFRCLLTEFDEALEEAAVALESRAIGIEEFWRAVKSVLRLKPLRAGGRTAQRGPRSQRGGSAPMGAAGGVRVRDGGEAVPAVPPARPVLPGRGPLPAQRRGHPRAHGGGVRTGRARLVRIGNQQGHHADDAFVSGVRRARRAQPALALPGRASAGGRGIARGAAPAALSAGTAAGRRKSACRACWNSCARRPRSSRPRTWNRSCSARSSISAGARCG